MKTEILPLSRITENSANPRTITDEKVQQLIASILVFPQMMKLRPIVVDAKNMILGGNMRYHALSCISEKSDEAIEEALSAQSKYFRMPQSQKEALLQYWKIFRDKPNIEVVRATDLTDEEVKEFIAKDNIGYGQWDWDRLANEWDEDELTEWGLDIPDFKTENEDDIPEEKTFTPTFKFEVECKTESDKNKIMSELMGRGFSCTDDY